MPKNIKTETPDDIEESVQITEKLGKVISHSGYVNLPPEIVGEAIYIKEELQEASFHVENEPPEEFAEEEINIKVSFDMCIMCVLCDGYA